MNGITPGFTGTKLDRVDHLREDADGLAKLLADPQAKLLLLDGLDPVLEDGGLLGWTLLDSASPESELALLGMIDGEPRFVALGEVPLAADRSAGLWQMVESMPGAEASTYAAARSLVDWHKRHGFCANCGAATVIFRAGWARRCDACNAQHFPRTDPVVIMIAEYEGKALLGRQPQFPPGRYSALAGFLEVGESIEEAVIRELREEAGVTASGVRYIASQPWPFPSSLMIACVAQAHSEEIVLDENELDDARWFTRDDVIAALNGEPDAPFGGPPHFAIAHSLLSQWVGGQ